MKHYWDSISSSPLFSSIITLYFLILLYFPHHFLRISFSPVAIITAVVFVSLLRISEHQSSQDNSLKLKEEPLNLEPKTEHCSEKGDTLEEKDDLFVKYGFETEESETGFDRYACFDDGLVEWNVKAPLEVIYEELEGEEDEKQGLSSLGRQPSLSLYYPETDSDTSSDGEFSVTGAWDSPEMMCYKWEVDDTEGLIEICLDGGNNRLEFQVDEDNLIEIDISPTRRNDFSGDKCVFPGEVRFS